MLPQPDLPQEADVVVVGSGAAGLATAVAAKAMGLDVVIIEKEPCFGGTTAFSGAAIWIPLTQKAQDAGSNDSRQNVIRYLDTLVGGAAPSELREAFVDHAAEALAFLEAHSELRYDLRRVAPDYHPEIQGAVATGRVLDVREFDGRKLGKHFADLKPPLPTHLVFGGMMVNRSDVQALLRFGRERSATIHSLKLIGRYARDRLLWKRGTRLVVGSALVARLATTLLSRQVPIVLGASVTRLERDEDRRVAGVGVTNGDGTSQVVRARHAVVLATGGFAQNDAKSRVERSGRHRLHFSMVPVACKGDGIELARSTGGELARKGASSFFWAPVSILRQRDGGTTRFAHLTLDRAKPGVIALDRQGRRFTNEADSYHRFGQALQDRPPAPDDGPVAWLVCDRKALRKYGLGLARPAPAHAGNRALIRSSYLVEAASLPELADRLSLPKDAVIATVEEHNRYAEAGEDPSYGKGASNHNRALGDPAVQPNPCLAPIMANPFYAVGLYGGDLGTARGLATDPHARVLDQEGRPVPGLYAVGNDMQSIMGGTYPGPGITLGPALTFAYLAARHIARRAAAPAKRMRCIA